MSEKYCCIVVLFNDAEYKKKETLVSCDHILLLRRGKGEA